MNINTFLGVLGLFFIALGIIGIFRIVNNIRESKRLGFDVNDYFFYLEYVNFIRRKHQVDPMENKVYKRFIELMDEI